MGQLVKISQQGLLRRKEAGRSDPSRGGVGAVVRVNANWSCGALASSAPANRASEFWQRFGIGTCGWTTWDKNACPRLLSAQHGPLDAPP